MKSHTTLATSLSLLCGGVALASLSNPAFAQQSWTDVNPSTASQCRPNDIDDAGTVILNCLINNAKQPFVKLGAVETALAPLAATPGGVGCIGVGLNNAVAGSEVIVGECPDANNVLQAVYWKSSTPTTAPTLLQPLPLLAGLRLVPDVRTAATAHNQSGAIVGASISGTGVGTPVVWSVAGGSSTLGGLLEASVTNCVPSDISNAGVVVGNCPAGAAGGGKENPVVWATTSTNYVTLPVPSGASYCIANEANTSGIILGACIYGTDTHRAVVWTPARGSYNTTVLMTVNGLSALRTTAADINDSGMVACNYSAGGAQAGHDEPCVWNSVSGTDSASINLPAGTTDADVFAIGNNGILVGNLETAGGNSAPMHVPSGSTTAVNDGEAAGGPNTMAAAISKGGIQEAATSETPGHNEQAEVATIH